MTSKSRIDVQGVCAARGAICRIIQSDSLARGPKLLSIKIMSTN